MSNCDYTSSSSYALLCLEPAILSTIRRMIGDGGVARDVLQDLHVSLMKSRA